MAGGGLSSFSGLGRKLTSCMQDYTTPQVLLDTKSRKQIVRTGATRFNTKPKTGLTFLEENKLIYHDLSPEVSKEQSLAAFLKSCNALDKKLLGDFISKPDHLELLRAFIGQFDFQNVGTCTTFELGASLT